MDTKQALATGIWIGEGSFRKTSRALLAYSCERDVLEILQDAFGGNIYGPYEHANPLSKKPSYQWSLSPSKGGVEAARIMWPCLTKYRREQIVSLVDVLE